MMKRFLAILMALVMVLALAACGGGSTSTPASGEGDGDDGMIHVKAGLICIGDENDQGYTYNFVRGAEAAKEELAKEGIDVEWIIKYNLVAGDPVAVANEELAEEGCAVIINNSYGQEDAMLQVAPDYPDVQFVGCTNEQSQRDELDNTHNAFNRAHEGRYVAGVVAGMKLQEMIDEGVITEDEAIIGYVGAYSYAEVISGYTAYYLGAKSVCPSVTMKVQFVGSWSDATLEANAAQALIDQGCVMISQHSDNTTPATTAEKAGVFHTGYNADMISAAPEASIISTRINWTNYFVYAIKAVANGENFDQDYCHGMSEGEDEMTELNEDICAAGTREKMEETIAAIKSGELQVFDLSTFTIDGQHIESYSPAIDTDGDFTPDSGEAVWDGAFHESELISAPYFSLRIDGITLLNEEY